MSVEITPGELRPAADARELFASSFYRMLVFHIEAKGSDFVISPAAVQKFLALVHNGAEFKLSDGILWDIRVKHIDMKQLHADAAAEGITDIGFCPHLRRKQMTKLNQPITHEAVLDFFRSDFTELGAHVLVKNFIVAHKELGISRDFAAFAEEYFETTILRRDSAEVAQVKKHFPNYSSDGSADVDFFSAVGLEVWLSSPFAKVKDELVAKGTFKLGELKGLGSISFRCDVLELPLEAELPMTMLLFLADNKEEFEWLLSQVMGRSLVDYNALLNTMTEEDVEVKLKEFKVEAITNLNEYFREIGYKGLRRLFSPPEDDEDCVMLSGIFENVNENGVQVNNFWQKASVAVTTKNPSAEVSESCQPAKKFDATDKSFFFVIKSEKVLYFMGHVVDPNFK